MKIVTVEELKQKLDKGEEVNLVDVREPHEFEEVNIGGRLVVLLDGKPIIAPKINEAIGKECELTGRLNRAVLLRFFEATVLRSLPAE